jgi:hypothetical protein
MVKSGISTVFLGICAEFAYIWPKILDFPPVGRSKTAKMAVFLSSPAAIDNANQRRPKSTFLRGARAAAMGVFSASTTGAASWK